MNKLKKKWKKRLKTYIKKRPPLPCFNLNDFNEMWQEIEDYYEVKIKSLKRQIEMYNDLVDETEEEYRKRIRKIFEDIDKIVGKIVNFDVLGYVELKKKHLGDD